MESFVVVLLYFVEFERDCIFVGVVGRSGLVWVIVYVVLDVFFDCSGGIVED